MSTATATKKKTPKMETRTNAADVPLELIVSNSNNHRSPVPNLEKNANLPLFPKPGLTGQMGFNSLHAMLFGVDDSGNKPADEEANFGTVREMLFLNESNVVDTLDEQIEKIKSDTELSAEKKEKEIKSATEANSNVRYGGLIQLAEDIEKHNRLLQPIMVRKREDGFYDIVFGARRYAAFLFLYAKSGGKNWTKIPAEVVDVNDEEAMKYAFSENLQRTTIQNPLDQAYAIKQMVDYGYSNEQVAEATGYSVATIVSRLTLLRALVKAEKEKNEEAIKTIRNIELQPKSLTRVMKHIDRKGNYDPEANKPTRTVLDGGTGSSNRVKITTKMLMESYSKGIWGGGDGKPVVVLSEDVRKFLAFILQLDYKTTQEISAEEIASKKKTGRPKKNDVLVEENLEEDDEVDEE